MIRRIPSFVAIALAVALTGSATAQPAPEPEGARTIDAHSNKVTDGSWQGTWFYVSRVYRIAIWMRESDGKPEMKLRIMGQANREAFETDWNSVAEYVHVGRNGRFWLEFDHRDSNSISGSWNWRFGEEGSARVETARFELRRTGDGRRMTLNLTDYERWMEKDPERKMRLDSAWTFIKASRHHALWPELPL